MSTIRQKRVARKIVEALNNGETITRQEVLKSSGYSEKTALTKQKKILEAKGVKEELEKYGFTEENAVKAVSKIMNANVPIKSIKPDDVLRATDQFFKVKGSYTPEKHQVAIIDLVKLYEEAKKLREARERS